MAQADPVPQRDPQLAVHRGVDPALLERELAVPEPGITLNEVWAMGSTDPRPRAPRAGFIPGREVQQAEPIEATLAQLPQSLAVGMNFTAAAGGSVS